MNEGVSDSKLSMWRAIFALAHADHVVTEEERRFMHKALDSEDFSDEQKSLLQEDMERPSDIADMFMQITEQQDRSQFFYFARMLLWCDGDFAAQEQAILTELQRAHYKMLDFNKIGQIDLQLEDDEKEWLKEDAQEAAEKPGVWERFLDRFRS